MTPAQQAWRDQQRKLGALRAETIRPLAVQRLTAERIGEMLGLTKNQVIGVCHRMGIALTSRRRPAEPSSVDPVKRAHHEAPLERKAFSFKGVPLRDKGCRWPAWGNEPPTHRYCGADKRAGLPYCQRHMKLAYRPANPI